jgi:hypothetical protein
MQNLHEVMRGLCATWAGRTGHVTSARPCAERLHLPTVNQQQQTHKKIRRRRIFRVRPQGAGRGGGGSGQVDSEEGQQEHQHTTHHRQDDGHHRHDRLDRFLLLGMRRAAVGGIGGVVC